MSSADATGTLVRTGDAGAHRRRSATLGELKSIVARRRQEAE
jgi:hypothetical protein